MSSFWTQLKAFFNNYKYVLLILLFLLLCFVSIRSYLKAKSDITTINTILKAQTDSISYYKDKTGKLQAQVISAQGSADIINSFYKPTIDSLSKQLGVKASQIQSYIGLIDSLSNTFITNIDTMYVHDTISKSTGIVISTDTSYRINYLDKWLSFSGSFKANSSLFTGSYQLKDSLTIVNYSKKSGFLGFGPMQYYIDVSSNNPNETITSIKNFSITGQTPKRFGVGPAIIGTFQSGKVSIVPGIGVFYSLFSF